MKNIYGVEIKPYSWQEEVKDKENVFIIAPTGAGKSIAAYSWAFNDDMEQYRRIIFTAPIKALSNERFLEIKSMGKDVGIITGDVQVNTDAKILCMTQEIYNNKFCNIPNQKVIIDEVHYMFQDWERSRAYVDGISNTNKRSNIMLLSATVNKDVINYFERISNRKYHLVHVEKRPVPTEYIGEVNYEDIVGDLSPSIVFLFSKKAIESVAIELSYISKEIDRTKMKVLNELIKKYNIKNEFLINLAKKGVSVYIGTMLFKEKIFVEELVRKKIVKAIVGTDALSLGVNFPIKTVIFGQLSKYYEGPITKREFLQMSGRAGRPFLYNIGKVGYVHTGFEAYGYDTAELFEILLSKPLEKEQVVIMPDMKKILSKIPFKLLDEATDCESIYEFKPIMEPVKEEIEYIKTYSLLNDESSLEDLELKLETDIILDIEYLIDSVENEEVYEILRKIYFKEFPIELNLRCAETLYERKSIDAFDFFFSNSEKQSQREMLQYLKFYNSLNEFGFKVDRLRDFRKQIEEDDEFVLNPLKLLSPVKKETPNPNL